MSSIGGHVDHLTRGAVWLIGTLDTKGAEAAFLKDIVQQHGLNARVIDVGVLGIPGMDADVTRDEIAKLGGSSIADLNGKADRGSAIAVMQRGLAKWVRDQSTESIGGLIAIGGSAGTAIASAGMRELPIGIPKLLVSTMASGDVRPYVGTSDITMMYSVTDFTGLNRLTRIILGNAARAIAGMCSMSPSGSTSESAEVPLIGATMFGVTTPCVQQVQSLLERSGFELLVFHATGTGGQAKERLIRDGFIKGVVDITTTELADELVGGVLTAGPDRLEAAGREGIPQVVSLGALDMVNFGPPETVPAKFRGRQFYQHNSAVTLMRTTAEENEALGGIIADRLNHACGPVKVLVPLRGVSAIDAVGKPFYDPNADKKLFDALRSSLKNHVELIELDMHINDVAFAERVASEFLRSFSLLTHFDHKASILSGEQHVC
jgi:uncharacterized protein (UPF0261 family)